MLKYANSLMYYLRLAYEVHLSRKFQVDTVANIEAIVQHVFSHARVMVIGVSSTLNYILAVQKWKRRVPHYKQNK